MAFYEPANAEKRQRYERATHSKKADNLDHKSFRGNEKQNYGSKPMNSPEFSGSNTGAGGSKTLLHPDYLYLYFIFAFGLVTSYTFYLAFQDNLVHFPIS